MRRHPLGRAWARSPAAWPPPQLIRCWLACSALLFFYGSASSSVAAPGLLSFSLDRIVDATGDLPVIAYSFRAGPHRFLFCPPVEWKISGEPTKMIIHDSGHGEAAGATFTISTPQEIACLDPNPKDKPLDIFLSKLPSGHTNLKIIVNPMTDYLPIHGFQSIEAEFHYNYFGRDLKSSVLICKMGDIIGFTAVATAPVRLFDEFIRKYRTLLCSMQAIPELPNPKNDPTFVRPRLSLQP